MRTKLPLYLALLLLTQCSKCKTDDPAPVDQLPPATQTGANTFGCLVNGQLFTPQGFNGSSNYSITVDPFYQGGNVGIRTCRYSGDSYQSIGIGGDSINGVGTYSLNKLPRSIFFTDRTKSGPCQNYAGDPGQYRRGSLVITRFDMQAGVIAGTFSFTICKTGCDTVRVTQGRFDKRL